MSARSADDALVAALARASVERVAPEELPLFRATSQAYFDDPSALERRESRDEMLGFGVDAAVMLVTPVALAVARDVIQFVADAAARAAREGRRGRDRPRPRPAAPTRRRAAATGGRAAATAELTDEQLEQVRTLALEKAKQLQALRREGGAPRRVARRRASRRHERRQAPQPERRPRLNPFVFPSDTTFRFALLVTAVLGASLYVWNWIFFAVRDPSDQLAKLRDCLQLSPLVTGVTDLDAFSAASDAFSACVNRRLPRERLVDARRHAR